MLYSNTNKIILFCTHTSGYVIYKHHTVGIVLKVNPQSHCCYQTQSIKHTLRKISQYQRYFYLFRKKEMRMHLLLKSKNVLRHFFKNSYIAKSPQPQCYNYDDICNNIIKARDRFVQYSASQFPAVLHTASLFRTCFRTST